jgi:hypothetical protein
VGSVYVQLEKVERAEEEVMEEEESKKKRRGRGGIVVVGFVRNGRQRTR